jgi:putative ABC transport system ATP-binding protein
LDEPTASLDPRTTQQVESLIQRWLAENPERACIWTSHDSKQLRRVTQVQQELVSDQ